MSVQRAGWQSECFTHCANCKREKRKDDWSENGTDDEARQDASVPFSPVHLNPSSPGKIGNLF
jgi:hypothetical protein